MNSHLTAVMAGFTTAALVPWLVALPAEALGLTAAYYGETFTHPGFLAGAEQRVASLAGAELLLAGHMGFYSHAGYADVAFARSELALRWPLPADFDAETVLGLGLLHSRPAGDLYAPGPTGAPEPVFNYGRPALMPSVALGVGRQWGTLGRSFGRLELFGQYPYNGYVLPHAALSLGWTWRLP